MVNTIVILTSIFPFGKSEPYFEEELRNISKMDQFRFKLFSLSPRKNDSWRYIPKNVELVSIFFKGYFFYLLYSVFVLADFDFYSEIFNLLRQKNLTLRKLTKLVTYLSRAKYEYSRILATLKNDPKFNVKAKNVFYSYRLEYQAYILIKLKKKFPNSVFIARAHRYDLYEEFSKKEYLPFQKEIVSSLDFIIAISEDGFKYLQEKYPESKDKIALRYLGTKDSANFSSFHVNREPLKIISCSNIDPVKRVNKIGEALSSIPKNINVIWTHFGDGEGLSKQELIRTTSYLPDNVTFILAGHVSSVDLMQAYNSEGYNVFVNVSTSEGLPVSIMEAFSFGVPVIATDVGGTSEIVHDGENGYPMKSNFDSDELRDKLLDIKYMDDSQYTYLKNTCRKTWEDRFNADKNYLDFCNFIEKLVVEE